MLGESIASAEEWFSQGRVAFAQKRSRTQMQWVLQLSGDFHPSEETAVPALEPHMMRVMLVSNLAVPPRYLALDANDCHKDNYRSSSASRTAHRDA